MMWFGLRLLIIIGGYMYVDPETGRSLLGFWNEEEKRWVQDFAGFVNIKMLANAFRERLEKNPESIGEVVLDEDLTDEEIAKIDASIAFFQKNELLYEIEIAQMELEIRAEEQLKAKQK